MNVLWDHQCFSMQRYGGISRHFASIHNHLVSSIKIEIPLFVGDNNYLPEQYNQLRLPLPRVKGVVLSKRLFNNRRALKHINASDYDVFHATYYDPYFVKNIKKPYVITIHDMIHELQPELLLTRDQKVSEWKKIITQNASAIVCVSIDVKNKLLQVYPNIEENKVHVIYHDSDLKHSSEKILQYKYILYVGNRALYKNYNSLLKAFKDVVKDRPEIRLVCAGGGGLSKNELNEIKSLGIDGKVVQINSSDEQLAKLYSNAELFVFPSRAEGFGIPLIEAFKLNCPVVCSNLHVFREVCGDAAMFFDPNDISDMSNSINEVLNSEILRNNLITSGMQRKKLFSWDDSAKELTRIYKNLVK